MSGNTQGRQEMILVDKLVGLDNKQQAEIIADYYASVSNQYVQLKNGDFCEYTDEANIPCIEPLKVY